MNENIVVFVLCVVAVAATWIGVLFLGGPLWAAFGFGMVVFGVYQTAYGTRKHVYEVCERR